MGIDLLDLAFRLERLFGVKVSPDQFSKLAMRNDPPDIRVGDLFDLLLTRFPGFGVLGSPPGCRHSCGRSLSARSLTPWVLILRKSPRTKGSFMTSELRSTCNA